MRLNVDLRNAVVFVGDMTSDEKGEEIFKPVGTAFFLLYKELVYLVTARHVAESLHPPFTLRASNNKGEPLFGDVIRAHWTFHTDENVDLAIGVGVLPKDAVAVGGKLLLSQEITVERGIGIGDEVNIVGLYRLAYGKKRNLPIVHTGAIAMVPEDEKIPQIDRITGKRRLVECYLVEAQTLEGLSGSPVFVRQANIANIGGKNVLLTSASGFLLGVWSGAWDAPPGSVLNAEHPDARRVPVGMGLTVPSYKLIELLESLVVVKHREETVEKLKAAKKDKT